MRKASGMVFMTLVILLSLFSTHPAIADQQIGNMTVKNGTTSFYPNGQLMKAVLAKEMPYAKGIVCRENDEIVIYPSGSLERCTVKNAVRLSNMPEVVIVVKAGTPIHVDRAGNIVNCVIDNGTRLKTLPVKIGTAVELDSGGHVLSFVLANDYQMGKATWKKDTTLQFHSNGNIHTGTLARDLQVVSGGRILKAGTWIRGDASGNIVEFK